jgi:hypothetical protein
MTPICEEVEPVFEEIEKELDGRDLVIAPQNHPKALLSFVWDVTAEGDDQASYQPEAAE